MTKAEARQMIAEATTLSQLQTILQTYEEECDPDEETLLDYSDLPTFGGPEPEDTTGIFSWDEDSILTVDEQIHSVRWLIEPRRNETPCAYCGTTEGRIEGSAYNGKPVCDACEARLERARSIAHDLLADIGDMPDDYIEAHEAAAEDIRALRPLSWILRKIDPWPDSFAWITTACGPDWPTD